MRGDRRGARRHGYPTYHQERQCEHASMRPPQLSGTADLRCSTWHRRRQSHHPIVSIGLDWTRIPVAGWQASAEGAVQANRRRGHADMVRARDGRVGVTPRSCA